MTHPFHPWSGREFLFVSVGHNWGEERVFFVDDGGVKHSLPVAGPMRRARMCSWRWLGGAAHSGLTT